MLVLVGDADQLTSVGTGSVSDGRGASAGGRPARRSGCDCRTASAPMSRWCRSSRLCVPAMPRRSMPPSARRPHAVPDVASLRRRLAAWARLPRGAWGRLASARRWMRTTDRVGHPASRCCASEKRLLCAWREARSARPGRRVESPRAARVDVLSAWSGRPYPGCCVMVTRNDQAARLAKRRCRRLRLANNGGGPLLQVAFERTPDAPSASAEQTTPACACSIP